jgi:hypothetical protein
MGMGMEMGMDMEKVMAIRVSQISIFLKFQYVEDGIHEQT